MKDMKQCDLNDRESKIPVLKKLSEMQENTDNMENYKWEKFACFHRVHVLFNLEDYFSESIM